MYVLGFALPFVLLTFFLGSTKWIVRKSHFIMKIGGHDDHHGTRPIFWADAGHYGRAIGPDQRYVVGKTRINKLPPGRGVHHFTWKKESKYGG